jgi:hypothetical protein
MKTERATSEELIVAHPGISMPTGALKLKAVVLRPAMKSGELVEKPSRPKVRCP